MLIRRIAANDAYCVAQQMVILGRTDALLNQFVRLIPTLYDNVSPESVQKHHTDVCLYSRLIGPLLRFYTHLVLVLRSLGRPVPDGAANIILQAYLSILEQGGDHNLVAMYAACLREGSGEESYARFLRGESAPP